VSEATFNGSKIRALLERSRDHDHADLYRTVVAGPRGQRSDVLVGRVVYRTDREHEFEIHDPREGTLVGYANRAGWDQWSITEYRENEGLYWLGYASSLAVGCDVLINGMHVALDQHTSRRISRGSIRKGPENPQAGVAR
jgi:hypothetical protein